MARRKVAISVYRGEQYCSSEFPGYNAKLVDVIAWLTGKLESIPAEYRSAATCDISSDTSYDSSYATVVIEYKRDETDAEAAERERRSAERAELVRQSELAMLADLQRKYGAAK